jgi:hypothetical protein
VTVATADVPERGDGYTTAVVIAAYGESEPIL